MELYLEGVINQQIGRARLLMNKIPRDLPQEFQLLVKTCRDLLNEYLADLQYLQMHPKMLDPKNQNERVKALRRVSQSMSILENVAIAALDRVDKQEDTNLNRLVEELCSATRYPLLRPITTTLTSDYFQIYPTFNLIRVPLLEMKSFLHLPDLMHELAHQFFFDENQHDDIIEPIREALMLHLGEVNSYYADFLSRKSTQRPSPLLEPMVRAWEESWVTSWGIEFICDLFAVYSLGPAFVWAHLLLVVKQGQLYATPQFAPISHPADEARMRLMLMALNELGFASAAADIQTHWKALEQMLDDQQGGYYQDCYPDTLLNSLCCSALSAFRAMNCAAYQAGEGGIRDLLNEAWHNFLADSTSYGAWEKEHVERMGRRLSGDRAEA